MQPVSLLAWGADPCQGRLSHGLPSLLLKLCFTCLSPLQVSARGTAWSHRFQQQRSGVGERGCLCAALAAPKVWGGRARAGRSGSAAEHSNGEAGTRHPAATADRHSPVGLKNLRKPGLDSGEGPQGREQPPPGLRAQAWWLCP